jgi:hypothetical protein
LVACAIAALSVTPFAFGQEQRPGRPALRLPVDPNLGVNSGKPDLGGKGMWELPYITDMAKARSGVTRATSVPFKPEAKKIFDQRADTLSKEDPEGYCLPPACRG